MDSVAEELLSKIPTGEEVKDPRRGIYHNAILKGVALSDDRSAVVLTFTGLRDVEGHDFEYPHRIPLPTRESEPWQQRMHLALLHDLQIVPFEDRSSRYYETDEAKDAIVAVIQQLIGTSYGFELKESTSGFLNLRFQRTSKKRR